MMLMKELRETGDSHFFWDEVSKQQQNHHNFQVYIGTLKFNGDLNNCDMSIFISELISDFKKKTNPDYHYFKLFHDLDNHAKPILHYLLIIDGDKFSEFKSTLIYAISKVNHIDDNLINYKNLINHYLEYHDYYGYQRVKTWAG